MQTNHEKEQLLEAGLASYTPDAPSGLEQRLLIALANERPAQKLRWSWPWVWAMFAPIPALALLLLVFLPKPFRDNPPQGPLNMARSQAHSPKALDIPYKGESLAPKKHFRQSKKELPTDTERQALPKKAEPIQPIEAFTDPRVLQQIARQITPKELAALRAKQEALEQPLSIEPLRIAPLTMEPLEEGFQH